MSAENPSPNGNYVDSFISDSNKLQENISKALTNLEEIHIEDIVGLYFTAINLSSIAKSIKQNYEKFESKISEKTLIKIQNIQNHINEKFNETLHPLIISHIERRINDYQFALKNVNTNSNAKTKKEIENQAKKFEELRKLMSTKEFVHQYSMILEN
jgi:leucyl aminopeptidase